MLRSTTTFVIAIVMLMAVGAVMGCSQPAPSAPPESSAAPAPAPAPELPKGELKPAGAAPAPSAVPVAAGPHTYELMPETKIVWSASVPIGTRIGGWAIFNGKIEVDGDNFETAKINVEVDMSSAWSDAAELTEKLKGEENFFNPVKFPKATFKSTSVKKTAEGYDVTGDLTIRDKTKSIVLPVRDLKMEGKKLTCKSKTVINRQDFGVTYQSAILDYTIKDTADLSLDVVAEAK